MKLLQKFLLVAVSLAVTVNAWSADLQSLLTEGQTAFMRGDMAAAKRSFQLANRVDPRNPTVIGFLKQIAAAEAKNPGATSSEAEYKGIVIQKIEFRDATLASALDFMKRKVADQTGGKKSVNFVLQLSPEQQNAPVSLTLSDIPFTEALRYIAESIDAKVEYQKFAVVIKPKNGSVAVTNAPAPQ